MGADGSELSGPGSSRFGDEDLEFLKYFVSRDYGSLIEARRRRQTDQPDPTR